MSSRSAAEVAGIKRTRASAQPRNAKRVATGYVPRSLTVHRIYNLVIGLALFIMVLPLFTAISLALLATQGREIFYAGARFGRDRRIFHILKFRSLDSKRAAELTRNGVLPEGSGVETPLGGLLRATRLDELPQLLNVIRGDMNLVGPRPVRPEIAEIYATEISNYNFRFRVKPGLLGHTQAFMSHSTSKHIRARYNSIVCGQPVCYRNEVGLIGVVGLCVLLRSVAQTTSALRDKMFGANSSSVLPVRVEFLCDVGRKWSVSTMNKQTVTLSDPVDTISGAETVGVFVITLPDRQVRRARVALLPSEAPLGAGEGSAEFPYRALSDFADYVISRYVLGQVVVPQKSLMLPGWMRSFYFRGFNLIDAPQTAFSRDVTAALSASTDAARDGYAARSAQV